MMTLRPHHLIDILTGFEVGKVPAPAASGHAVHVVVARVNEDLDQPVRFILGPDDICAPCESLGPDGACARILEWHDPPQPMDEYNDDLDGRLFAYLDMEPEDVLTLREFFGRVNARTPGIEVVCTSPVSDPRQRLAGIITGLTNLGIRQHDDRAGGDDSP